ncbi:MAG TPA: hypothetical protein P5105_04630 [Victivallales bacterium]|nr:hypothetical protein [Victivallales bacterium]HPO90223.1 hypothetical protein [Victivallales bacterium]HRR06548.1 hypothetical protein [Victivallales bacterium]HRR28695.1 hypothetical protein [Victivallales bacterium]HRU00759.1 hypothetical protein [Victivallales bacterium]
MEQIQKNIKNDWGFSFAGKNTDLNNIISILEQNNISSLDISFDLLSASFISKIKTNFPLISINHLINIDIRNILNEKASFSRLFLIEFEKKLNELPDNFAKFATVNINLEDCAGDMFYYEDCIHFLRKIAIILYTKKINLCIPERVPAVVKDANTEFYRKILSDIMLPNIYLAIEIYPHELMDREKFQKTILENRFDTGIIRIKYDTLSGNIISKNILSCIKIAINCLPSVMYFFDPMRYDYPFYQKEIRFISEMFAKIEAQQEMKQSTEFS